MNQPPAFQFYASDYLSSSSVQRMTLEEEGAFIRLLAYNWQDGFIPNDIKELSKLCKCSPKKMAAIWERLKDRFRPMDQNPGKLVNSRLEQVRIQQLEFRRKKSEAGRTGGLSSGQARTKQEGSTASALLEANAKQDTKQNEALQSPSPSSVSIGEHKKGNNTFTRTRKTSAPAELPISPSMQAWASTNKITADLTAETEAMLDHWRAKGETRLDWIATWRTWMRNTKKFHRNGASHGTPKESYGDRVARENRETAARFNCELSDTTRDDVGAEDSTRASRALLPRSK